MTRRLSHLSSIAMRCRGHGRAGVPPRSRRYFDAGQPRSETSFQNASSQPMARSLSAQAYDWSLPERELAQPSSVQPPPGPPLRTDHTVRMDEPAQARRSRIPRPPVVRGDFVENPGKNRDSKPTVTMQNDDPIMRAEAAMMTDVDGRQDAPAEALEAVPDAHAVFDRMGRSMHMARTFDLGSIDVDAHLDRLERSIAQSAGSGEPAPPAPVDVSPIDDMEILSDIAFVASEFSGGDGPPAPSPEARASADEPSSNGAAAAPVEAPKPAPVEEPAPPQAVSSADEAPQEAEPVPEPDNAEPDPEVSADMPWPPLVGAAVRLLAALHGLDPEPNAVREGRGGWAVFSDLAAAETPAQVIAAAGLTEQEIGDAAALSAVVKEAGKVLLIPRSAPESTVLIEGIGEDGLLAVAGEVAGGESVESLIARLTDGPDGGDLIAAHAGKREQQNGREADNGASTE